MRQEGKGKTEERGGETYHHFPDSMTPVGGLNHNSSQLLLTKILHTHTHTHQMKGGQVNTLKFHFNSYQVTENPPPSLSLASHVWQDKRLTSLDALSCWAFSSNPPRTTCIHTHDTWPTFIQRRTATHMFTGTSQGDEGFRAVLAVKHWQRHDYMVSHTSQLIYALLAPLESPRMTQLDWQRYTSATTSLSRDERPLTEWWQGSSK